MTEPIAIGIVAYHATHDLTRCLQAITVNTRRPHQIVLCDNSEGNATNVRVAEAFGAAICHRGRNLGCAAARNRIWDWTRRLLPQAKYMVILDQDVRVQRGWLDDALELFEQRQNAGIVCWPCSNMGNLPVRKDGCLGRAASVCNVHLLEAVEAAGGWDETFFMYRFDSLFAERTNQAGYRTYVVMKHYQPGVSWKAQKGGIIHDHPHQGVRRNPRWQQLQQESQTYYDSLKRREGWTEFDPMAEAEELWDASPTVLACSSGRA